MGEQPDNTEEYRARMRLAGTAWTFSKIAKSNATWLKDMDPKVFDEFADYILGKKVLNI